MCGIAGWFTNNQPSNPNHILEKMAEAIRHRGPDGEGFWHSDNVGFAHKRLSIIGLEDGHQPMHTSCLRFTISFNGEIYNYKSLKSELIKKGAIFKTQTDTEVILNLFKFGGLEQFYKLRGMYAIAIWDSHENEGYLIRDPMGIKPLFYSESRNSRLFFGSEAKAIINSGEFQSKLDENSLHQLMNFRYLPCDNTMFQGINQVKPGHAIHWKNGAFTEIKLTENLIPQNFESIFEAIKDSVGYHLVSDTEIGAYLSGGIDSSSIVAIAKQHFATDLKTYTLNIGDDPLEASNARETARILGIKNIQFDLDQNVNLNLHNLIWHLECPKVNSLQVSILSQLTSEYTKVALSGVGADELFYGYNIHSIFKKINQQKNSMKLLKNISLYAESIRSQLSSNHWTELQRFLLAIGNHNNPPVLYGLLRNVWDMPGMRNRIYGERMLNANLNNQFDWLESTWPISTSELKSVIDFEKKHKLINDLLWQEDRCSMANGLETRVPFVDKSLFNYVDKLREDFLFYKGIKKFALKESLEQTLPRSILNRKKSGFQVNAPSFFKENLKMLSEQYLNREYVNSKGIFNYNFIKDTLKLSSSKFNRWHFFMLYLMIGTHIWLEIFED